MVTWPSRLVSRYQYPQFFLFKNDAVNFNKQLELHFCDFIQPQIIFVSSFAVPIKTISLTLTLYWNITFLSRNIEQSKVAGETWHSKEQIPTNFSTSHFGQCLPSTVQTTVNQFEFKVS